MKNLIEAITNLELAFAALGIKPPTIVLQNRGEMGSLLFELHEGRTKLRKADKKKVKHCADNGLEFMIGEVTIWADYDANGTAAPLLINMTATPLGTNDVVL
jgi:hypothetical protein